ncbi:MAG: trehalose 2-sulfotransferase [Actinomycetota bacterium]|jgi:LPS sulfotransferase NodH|nr:trehalose 2-sulfotransferase [Actinomycetota bacterium]
MNGEAGQAGYLLCGTPRTGSTLLCGALTATGIAARPESYFREQDELQWAARLRVRAEGNHVLDYDELASAARRAGTTPNGVFGARVMWGTLEVMLTRLRQAWSTANRDDLAILEQAFGPLRFIYLRRQDVVAQAVSWARAEQTGYWQEGDQHTKTPPRYDHARVDDLVHTIGVHNDAWRTWFAANDIHPHEISYELLITDVPGTVQSALAFLGLEDGDVGHPVPGTARQADHINAEWITRYLTGSG